MGRLASINQHGRVRASHGGRALKPRRASRRRQERRIFGASCAFIIIVVFLASSAPGGAQSGRRQPTPSASPAPQRRTPAQRPRTVSTPSVYVPDPSEKTDKADPVSNNETTVSQPSVPAKTGGAPDPSRPSSGSTSSAANRAEEIDEDEVVRINSNLVPVPASVLDAQGRAVLNLELKDFELRVDGELKPIGEVSRAETPVRMAVLFDNSSSLTAGRDFEKKAAVRFFRSVLRPVDQAALYSISTDPSLILPLTSDTRALTRIVEHFPQPEGATSLFDAIAMAAEYLRPHAGRKVLVIVSDGVDTTSRLDFDETLRQLLASDCQFFAVQTGHSDNTNLRDLVAERRLQEFAAQTGGAVYAPKSTSDLDVAFAQISADLAQQYILSYYPSDERRDGRFRAFTVRVVTRRDVRVRTRRGYYAPKG